MRLFSNRASCVWSRPQTGICRVIVGVSALPVTPSSTMTGVVVFGDLGGRHDGVSNALTQARRLRPFAALNNHRSTAIPPIL